MNPASAWNRHGSTRRLALTTAGDICLERVRVRSILSDIDAADEAAQSHSQEMSGLIRVLSLPARGIEGVRLGDPATPAGSVHGPTMVRKFILR